MISNRHYFVQTSQVSSTTEKLQQSLSSHLIKMKASLSLISATAAIVSVANGFAVTDCNAGITYNFSGHGNGKCQIWGRTDFFSYQSDVGCTLSAFSGDNCVAAKFGRRTHNKIARPLRLFPLVSSATKSEALPPLLWFGSD
jgi:hypothetical protein